MAPLDFFFIKRESRERILNDTTIHPFYYILLYTLQIIKCTDYETLMLQEINNSLYDSQLFLNTKLLTLN